MEKAAEIIPCSGSGYIMIRSLYLALSLLRYDKILFQCFVLSGLFLIAFVKLKSYGPVWLQFLKTVFLF